MITMPRTSVTTNTLDDGITPRKARSKTKDIIVVWSGVKGINLGATNLFRKGRCHFLPSI
jgi:hypothetical protein